MTNLPCECQDLKPKGETNSSFLVLHPLSGVHTVKTVGSYLKIGELSHFTVFNVPHAGSSVLLFVLFCFVFFFFNLTKKNEM